MKNAFSLINLLIGLFSLLIGVGHFQHPASNASSAVAGLVAVAVGLTCLWLSNESAARKQ